MSFTFNGQAVTSVTFNGSPVSSVTMDGVNRWSSAAPYTYSVTSSLTATDTEDLVTFSWTETSSGSAGNSSRTLQYRWKVDSGSWTEWTNEPWADFWEFNMSSIYGQYQQHQTIYFELRAVDNRGTTWDVASASQYVTVQAPVSMVASFIDDDSVRLDWDCSRTRPFVQFIMQYRHATTEAGVSSASWQNWYEGYSAVSYNILSGATGGNYYQFRGHLTPDGGLTWSDWKESNIQQTAPANMVINLYSPTSNYQRLAGSGTAQPSQTAVDLWRSYKTSRGSTSSLTSWTSWYNSNFYLSSTHTTARSGRDYPIPPYTSFHCYVPYNRYARIVSYSKNDAGVSDATYDYGYSNILKPYLTNAYNADGFANMGIQNSYNSLQFELHVKNLVADYVDEVYFSIRSGNGSTLSWWKINFTTKVYSTSGSTETVGWYDPSASGSSSNSRGISANTSGSLPITANQVFHVTLLRVLVG